MFTNHLAAISEQFKSTVTPARTRSGRGEQPRRRAQRRRDRDHHQTPGAIGYIEWGYANSQHAGGDAAERGGQLCGAGWRGGPLALADAQFNSDSDLRVWITDPKGAEAYPVATFTWMLFYKKQDAARAEALRGFVEWALKDGQAMAEQLGYIACPRRWWRRWPRSRPSARPRRDVPRRRSRGRGVGVLTRVACSAARLPMAAGSAHAS